jgi:hypothetical protein
MSIRTNLSVRRKVRLANKTTINNTIKIIALRKLATRVFSSSSGKTGGDSSVWKRAHISLKFIAITSYLLKHT